jgi:hypothetical protein
MTMRAGFGSPVWRGLVCAAVVLLAVGPAVSDEPSPEPPRVKFKLAYVYRTNKVEAGKFKKCLDEAGLSTDLVAMSDVANTRLARYDVILIASDTQRTWDINTAQAIDRAKKPILALGEGVDFFGKLRLKINLGQCWHGRNTGVEPVNHGKSPFWTSMKPALKDGKAITVYRNTRHVGVYLPRPGKDILLLGKETNNATHYPLVQQGTRYVLWGFSGPPDDMTPAGKKLFLHTCRYTARLQGKPAAAKKKDSKKTP